MILIKVPKEQYGFLRNIVKKLRRLEKNKYYKLNYKLYFSEDDALIELEDDLYHLAFALSIKKKCENRNLDCPIYVSIPVSDEFIDKKVHEAAEAWSLHRLPAKYLKLRGRSFTFMFIEKEGDAVEIRLPTFIIRIKGRELQVRRYKVEQTK